MWAFPSEKIKQKLSTGSRVIIEQINIRHLTIDNEILTDTKSKSKKSLLCLFIMTYQMQIVEIQNNY